jgi:hypothetical protein
MEPPLIVHIFSQGLDKLAALKVKSLDNDVNRQHNETSYPILRFLVLFRTFISFPPFLALLSQSYNLEQ